MVLENLGGEDEILKELERQKIIIDARIQQRKREIAMARGEVVQFIKDLKCERHPEAKFVFIEEVEGGCLFPWKGEYKYKRARIYGCKECLKEAKEKGVSWQIKASIAYQCPLCGLVKGDFEKRKYRSSEESWLALAGREGVHYHCRICGTQIGCYYWAYS